MWIRLGIVACSMALATPAAPAASQASIEQLEWLAGCWTGGTDDRRIDEQWMKPAGGTMLGMGRTVVAGRTVASEFLELREEGPGIVYIARPAGQAVASFTLVSAGETDARFENPEHDFPQSISYRLLPDGSLHARIEGMVEGKARAVDFPMTRSRCEM